MFDQNGLKSFCNERNLQVAPGGIGCLQYGHSLSAWFKTSSGSDFIGSSLTLHYWLLLLQLRAEMFYVLATVTCLRRHAVSLSLTLSLVSFSPLLLLLLSVSLSHHLTFTLSHFCWNFFLPFSSLDFFFWKLTFVCFFFCFTVMTFQRLNKRVIMIKGDQRFLLLTEACSIYSVLEWRTETLEMLSFLWTQVKKYWHVIDSSWQVWPVDSKSAVYHSLVIFLHTPNCSSGVY